MTIEEKAYAKLNLTLDVTAKRPDGYHDMSMVMQTVSLCDELQLTENDSGIVHASTNFRYIPGDERNLAVQAALVFLRAAQREGQGLVIDIRKRIPAGAGMGGGSSDAAAVLRALNRMYGAPFSTQELLEMAAEIGSDVAFCVTGGTQLAQGRGEVLSDLPQLPECRIVICKPGFPISTPELFRKLDGKKLRHHPDTAGMLEALAAGDLSGICRRMYNVFEDVDDRRLKTIAEIKRALLDAGACAAIMTGTGSAVFGVFTQTEIPEELTQRLRAEYGFCETAVPVGRLME